MKNLMAKKITGNRGAGRRRARAQGLSQSIFSLVPRVYKKKPRGRTGLWEATMIADIIVDLQNMEIAVTHALLENGDASV